MRKFPGVWAEPQLGAVEGVWASWRQGAVASWPWIGGRPSAQRCPLGSSGGWVGSHGGETRRGSRLTPHRR